MKRKARFKIAVSVFLAVLTAAACLPSNGFYTKTRSVKLKTPAKGAVVNTADPLVLKWWNNYEKYSSAQFKTVEERAKPTPVFLKWRGKMGRRYTVQISTSRKLRKSRVIKTRKLSVMLYNLLRNKKYYWRVSRKSGKKIIRSKIRSFKTINLPRIIHASGVANIRDIGGYKTYSGKITRQGRVFRSENIDGISESGKRALRELKIKTELDLRRIGEGEAGIGLPAFKNYKNLRGSQYEDIFINDERRERFIKGVKVFANRKNYPVLIHCKLGRDRTGTLVFVLNGLIGVRKKDLYRDYELSFLTRRGSSHAEDYISSFDRLYKRMASYKDKSKPLSYNIKRYLLDSGMTKREIKNIIKLLK